MDEMVMIFVPRCCGQDNSDLVVSLNGGNYRLKRGRFNVVPSGVAEVYYKSNPDTENCGCLPDPAPDDIGKAVVVGASGYYELADLGVGISYETVEELPETGEPGVIYLVPIYYEEPLESGDPNAYDEYLWVNNAFEKIGSTEIDLSSYAQKPVSATEGHLAGLDASGNLTDSGIKADDVVTYVTITVNVSDENGTQGQTTVKLEDPLGVRDPVTVNYSGQPVTFKLVPGESYKISAGGWLGHFPATPAYVEGIATTNTLIQFVANTVSNPTTLAELAFACQHGAASQLTIGTQIIRPWSDGLTQYQYPFDIVDLRYAGHPDPNKQGIEDENGVLHDGAIIQAHYATPNDIQFDAPEQVEADEATAAADTYYYGFTSSGNVYTLLNLSTGDALPYGDYDKIFKNARRDTTCNMIRYGYNRYRDSAYRQWLNSIAGTGEWWSATHVGDAAPSQLNSVAGFMSGFTAEDRALMKKCKITCYTNSVTDGSVIDTMYDTWFLASGTEMYGSVNANEGTYFQYWKEATGLSSPSNNNNEGRIAYSLTNHSQACWHWLRSAGRYYSHNVWPVGDYGNFNTYGATNAGRALPACAIY